MAGRLPVVAEQPVVVGTVTKGWLAAGAANGARFRGRGGTLQRPRIVIGPTYSSQPGKPFARCWGIQISTVGRDAMQSDERGKL
ncbi:MAG: hypothetical protein RIS70_517 [Planctomycetota bacterium]